MTDWKTIWDHEIAAFGQRILKFAGKGRAYFVRLDDRDQDEFTVEYDDAIDVETWSILNKEERDGTMRLSGINGVGPYPPESFWYELTLSSPAVLRFYGDRVLLHEDWEETTDQ